MKAKRYALVKVCDRLDGFVAGLFSQHLSSTVLQGLCTCSVSAIECEGSPVRFDNNVVSLIVVSSKDTYNVQLSLWDTSGRRFEENDAVGHEEFERLRPLQYANTNVFLLCFSIVQPETFESIMNRWVPGSFTCWFTYCRNFSLLSLHPNTSGGITKGTKVG